MRDEVARGINYARTYKFENISEKYFPLFCISAAVSSLSLMFHRSCFVSNEQNVPSGRIIFNHEPYSFERVFGSGIYIYERLVIKITIFKFIRVSTYIYLYKLLVYVQVLDVILIIRRIVFCPGFDLDSKYFYTKRRTFYRIYLL